MDLLLSFAAVAVVVVLGYIGYLEWQKASKERRLEILSRLIKAAEMTVKTPDGHPSIGAAKYRWVSQRLQSYFPKLKVEEIEEMIEAGVYELKRVVGSKSSEIDDKGGAFWYGTGQHN